MSHRSRTVAAALVAAAVTVALGGCGGGSDDGDATTARGPITIWYSNNPEEVAWGKAMVAAWNAAHADQLVTAQEIPAGTTSEEVISAAITGGNAPCLILNTSPAAVPQFQRQGGLVALDSFPDGRSYLTERSGTVIDQYRSADGKFYQLPWKANPVMIFYNRQLFARAGLDPANPQLRSYADVLTAARRLVASRAAPVAIWPAPTSEFFQSWFDFYPLYAAETGGRQLVEQGRPTFDSDAGRAVAGFWRTMYAEGLASREKYTGDAFADGRSAMAIVGPWAVAVYQNKVDWGAVPVPTAAGRDPAATWTFSDAKNIAMYSACRNRATAWDVLKFATSPEQDGKFLAGTGQMPMRHDLTTSYAGYFAEHPAYRQFADQAARTVEVPNIPGSIKVWQTFRDAWTSSVVSGGTDPAKALATAADAVAKKVNG